MMSKCTHGVGFFLGCWAMMSLFPQGLGQDKTSKMKSRSKVNMKHFIQP